MKASSTNSSVRDRIVATAFDLFYRQGYRATGINQVIAESGVAKASFYDHFPSKDDLLLTYVQESAHHELAAIRAEVGAMPTPRERFFGPFNILLPWFKLSDYRGCPFQNVMVEVPADNWRVREVARDYHESIRVLLRELTEELVKSDKRLRKLDTAATADAYLLMLEGAIALAVAYRQPWPVERGIEAMAAHLAAC